MHDSQMNDLEASKPVPSEKLSAVHNSEDNGVAVEVGSTRSPGLLGRVKNALTVGSVEARGIMPVPLEERTSTEYHSYFSIWFCMNSNILPVTFGLLGPTAYGLGLRDCALITLFFTLLTAALVSFLGTLGPKTGLRQMIQARYSFGRYAISIPVILNLATLTGFCVVICVVGGQCLSAAAGGSNLSPSVGIVIVGILALIISFCGYKVLHIYERFAWIPALIAIIIATGTGGSGLRNQAPTEPATAASVLSYGMIVASYMIPYGCLSSDFTTYLNPNFSSVRLFCYGYAGSVIPSVLLLTLGAAIGGALANNPDWEDGYDSNGVGGIMAAMLSSVGGFGRFVVVVLSFTMLGNISATMYSITLNFQMLIPQLIRVPRYVFAILITAIVIPVSIKAAVDFFDNLENFVSLIGYWSAAFLSVLVVEHVVFRRGQCSAYNAEDWNSAHLLPWGVAALASAVLSFGLIIPSMSQIWFTGPIAQTTGDIGFELAIVVTAILYIPFRYLEKKFTGR